MLNGHVNVNDTLISLSQLATAGLDDLSAFQSFWSAGSGLLQVVACIGLWPLTSLSWEVWKHCWGW
jgi:hypothetical protein